MKTKLISLVVALLLPAVAHAQVANTSVDVIPQRYISAAGVLTGPIKAIDGTEAAPSIVPASDLDTGVYFGADIVNFGTGGVGRFRVTGTQFQFRSSQTLEWSPGALGSTSDLSLARATTRVLALGPTTGVSLSWATDGTLRLRNFANSADGNLIARDLTTTTSLFLSNGTRIEDVSSGVLLFRDAAGSSFNRAQLGGTTAGFPAIKRDAADIAFKLADDSAFTGINASHIYLRGATQVATAGVIRLSHGGDIYGRNSANTLDRQLFAWGAVADELSLGTGAAPTRIRSSLATIGSPANGDWWVDCTGTSPSRVCAIKVFDGAATRTIASMTY